LSVLVVVLGLPAPVVAAATLVLLVVAPELALLLVVVLWLAPDTGWEPEPPPVALVAAGAPLGCPLAGVTLVEFVDFVATVVVEFVTFVVVVVVVCAAGLSTAFGFAAAAGGGDFASPPVALLLVLELELELVLELALEADVVFAAAGGLLAAGVLGGEADCTIGSHQPGPKTIATAASNPTAVCSQRRAAEDVGGRRSAWTSRLVLMRPVRW
jgi:hypothetical protein